MAEKSTTKKAATKKASPKKAARPRAPNAAKASAAPAKVAPRPPAAKAGSDWRVDALSRVRRLIHEADPEAVEEAKWRKPSNGMVGVPTWSHDGILCTGETYTDKVKLTFAKGAALPDPARLFNSSLEGNTRRVIDIHEGVSIDEKAFKALIRAAAALNAS